MVITISGSSGVGKTTIAQSLLKRLSNAGMVVSITTRDKRDNDNPGEYRYVSNWQFNLLDKFGVFLWTVDIHGNKYGTLKWSVKNALKRYDNIFMMLLVPDRVKNLLEYARELGSEEFVASFYILSPSPEILKKRLQDRGDSEFEIAKRIKDCEKWDAEALASDSPYIYIRNDDKVENAVEDIVDIITSGIKDQLF